MSRRPDARALSTLAVLMLLVPVLVGGASAAGVLSPLEAKSLDLMMAARHVLYLDPEVDLRIVLVELDEPSQDALGNLRSGGARI